MMGARRPEVASVVDRLRDAGFAVPCAHPKIEWFGDTPKLAHELGDLVRRGVKRASAGLLAAWQADGDPLPQVGDIEIIIDWSGEPMAVVEVTEVRVLPFDQVDDAFAGDEGEGDGSRCSRAPRSTSCARVRSRRPAARRDDAGGVPALSAPARLLIRVSGRWGRGSAAAGTP